MSGGASASLNCRFKRKWSAIKIQSILRGLITRLLAKVPSGIRWKATRGLLESQGIGWGASTTDFEAKAASRLLEELGIESPIAFDVGANVGEWSKALILHSPGSVSYAFEPAAQTFLKLIKNVGGNKSIFPINMGMSEKKGTATLFSNTAESGLASLSERRLDHFNISMAESEEIVLSTIDTFIDTHGKIPSIIKLDVEGHELSALLGATESIAKIPLIQFEFGGCNLDSRTTFQDFWYFFLERNFSIYRLGPGGVSVVHNYSELYEIYMTTNYFAVNNNYRPDNLA